MIEVRIYNPSLELKGIIDEFSSLIWIRRYFEPGEFELHTPYSASNRALLVPENIVQRFDGKAVIEAGVIETLDMTEDEIVIKGRFLESYLDRRLIKATTNYSGAAETSMRRIINEMVAIPLLSLGSNAGIETELEFQVTYKNVLRTLQKIAKSTGIGFRIRPDFQTRELFFECYEGRDRTLPTDAKVTFSETYDNLADEEYKFDETMYKTKAFVTYTQDDIITCYETGEGEGLNLREVHVGASVNTNGLTPAEIQAAMITEGQEALASDVIAESFTFSTNNGTFEYRHDYDIGDVIYVRHRAWNYANSLRISEVEEDYEEGGMEIILTCGTTAPEVVNFEEE